MSRTKNLVSRRSIVAAGAVATGMALTPTRARSQVPARRAMQVVIGADIRMITLVNVFTVESGTLPSLLDFLREGTEAFFSTMPGFISSSVLAARNARRVIKDLLKKVHDYRT